MRLTDHDIEEFKQVYAREFGGPLSDAEAREMADRVLRLVALVFDTPLEDEAR